MPVQSDAPKREAALGLLYENGDFQSTLQSRERWNGTFTASGQPEENRLTAYLLRFAKAFPQAANRLFGSVCSRGSARGGVRLAPSARMELETIWANERAQTPGGRLRRVGRLPDGLETAMENLTERGRNDAVF